MYSHTCGGCGGGQAQFVRVPCADVGPTIIPGWGVDLDPADRPSVPRERTDLDAGAHWDFPERQEEKRPRERSIEHKFLTPVFVTAQPIRGLSAPIRKLAYRYGEGWAAHWLLLLTADRLEAGEHHFKSKFMLRPDNPITETGIRSEFTHHGLSSGFGRNRADLSRTWMDPFIVAQPWIMSTVAVLAGAKAVRSRRG
jgi:hypothetical protein